MVLAGIPLIGKGILACFIHVGLNHRALQLSLTQLKHVGGAFLMDGKPPEAIL